MEQLNYRYLLRIILEASTPLQIGSGEKGIKTDSLVVRDVNGLPFIPGTTLAGLIAHALGKEKESLMGSQKEGSRLIVTEAKLLDRNGEVLDGLVDWSNLDEDSQAFLNNYKRLPIRQHVCITQNGTAKNRGKFDEEVILKGSRFCFEMELMGTEEDKEIIQTLLSIILSPTFRIGSGSRSGFGEVKVVECYRRDINLSKEEDRGLYLQKSSKLGSSWDGWIKENELKRTNSCDGWTRYRLSIKPEDFMLFGSGFGDPDAKADMTYVQETFIDWATGIGIPIEQEKTILIPASSVKGALSHRTAFHYNKLSGKYAEEVSNIEDYVGENNDAIKAIFGSADKERQRGNILISDVIKTSNATSKILYHVAIDRFTGGAIDGALFQEQTLYAKGDEFDIDIIIANKTFDGNNGENVRSAFEAALKDVASGMLPLGGGVNRGNGIFIGKVNKFNNEKAQWVELA